MEKADKGKANDPEQKSGDLSSTLAATNELCDLGQVDKAFHLLVLILLFKKKNAGAWLYPHQEPSQL